MAMKNENEQNQACTEFTTERQGKTIIGVDNGVSGSLGILEYTGKIAYLPMPVKTELNYTKTVRHINRIDVDTLKQIFCAFNYFSFSSAPKEPLGVKIHKVPTVLIIIERPMVNPSRFQATASALRALEATLIAVEAFKFPYQYIDSREWQKKFIPAGIKGPDLKRASVEIGKRFFPGLSKEIDKQGDADGLLIALHAQRSQW